MQHLQNKECWLLVDAGGMVRDTLPQVTDRFLCMYFTGSLHCTKGYVSIGKKIFGFIFLVSGVKFVKKESDARKHC